jgi:rhodanese-related sulfurtransferase
MTERSAIDQLLEDARSSLVRVAVADLHDELRDGALLVDIRPRDQRELDGELPGSLVIDRNVLEWRLDPTCDFRIPEATSSDLRVILVCNEGYGSSLAAANLQRLGLPRATDLIGGYQEWRAAHPA